MPSRNVAAAFLILLGGLGCAGKPPVPVLRGDALDRLRSLREARVVLRSLKAEARIEVRRKGRKFRFQADLLAERPGRLYAETGGFGMASAAVSVEGGKALVFFPTRGEAYRGDSREILENVLGVSQSAEEWVGLLLGDLPPHDDPLLEAKDRGRTTVMTLGSRNPRVILESDRGSSWLQSFTELAPRRRTLVFGKPMATTAGNVPSEIRVDVPGTGSVTIKFRSVVANPGLPDGSFSIPLPAHVEPRPLGGAELLIPE